eukprot:scaffold11442_cov21-Tisochrysis_lutea.AAC.1
MSNDMACCRAAPREPRCTHASLPGHAFAGAHCGWPAAERAGCVCKPQMRGMQGRMEQAMSMALRLAWGVVCFNLGSITQLRWGML